MQRRCPHLQGDLSRFGRIEDGVLTCQLHGWQFELATGRCLTAKDGPCLKASPAGPGAPAGVAPTAPTE